MSPRSRRPVGPLCLVVLLAVLVSCGDDVAVEGDGRDVLPTITTGGEPGLAHVHGLGINPADGYLYVATHFGLWRVVDRDEAERVGDHHLDLMGFTVVGEDHFLASGHPPPTDELPSNLGLIETRDAGETWRSVSLLGSADFHALRYAHDRTYGWDTATSSLLISEDGEEWDDRGEVRLFDLVVHPDDPDHLLGTLVESPQELRLARSVDGGTSWEEVDGAPHIARLAWTEADRIVGVGPDGAVWVGGAEGRDWDAVGAVPGFPEALLDTGDEIHVAIGDAIVVSADGGSSFETLLDHD